MLLLTWRRALVFLPNPGVGRRVAHDALGLIAAAVFLVASDPIHLEMQIRPEGVCAFLLSINLWLVVQFVACCFIENRQKAAVAYGIALVFSSILLASVKPSFVLVAFLPVLVVANFLFRPHPIRQKIALASGAAACGILLLLPEHSLSRNDENSRTFLPTTLFVIHANLIRDQMADDLRRGAQIPYLREWLESVYAGLSAEIANSVTGEPRYYVSSGFAPDYLMYNDTSIAARLRREFDGNIPALCKFYWFYYWRIWRQRPFLVIKKIARQMLIFYAPMCPAYNGVKLLPFGGEYELGVKSLEFPLYRETWTAYPPAVDFMDHARFLARSAPLVQQRAFIRKPLGFLAAAYLPSLFVAVGLGAFVLFRKTHRSRYGWLAALVLFTYSYNFTACLEVAVVHLLEYRRYITVQMYFTLLAQFFVLWFMLEFTLENAWPRKTTAARYNSP